MVYIVQYRDGLHTSRWKVEINGGGFMWYDTEFDVVGHMDEEQAQPKPINGDVVVVTIGFLIGELGVVVDDNQDAHPGLVWIDVYNWTTKDMRKIVHDINHLEVIDHLEEPEPRETKSNSPMNYPHPESSLKLVTDPVEPAQVETICKGVQSIGSAVVAGRKINVALKGTKIILSCPNCGHEDREIELDEMY